LNPHPDTTFSPPGLPSKLNITRKAGTGGGCITSTGGLPKNFTISKSQNVTALSKPLANLNLPPALGPVAPNNAAINTPDNVYGYKKNTRCLKRDFDPALSAANLAYANVSALLQSPTIHEFRPRIDSTMHPSSHTSIGGDLFDLFSSPTDPAFYLLHSQIDRLWTIWQGQDFDARGDGLDGTLTFLNFVPSANATLDTVMHMFEAGGDMPIRDAMSTYGGDYCYKYE
jgi:tyrosinase